MAILHLAIVNVIISLSALLNVTALNDLGYSIERYDESPGIYYENKDVAVGYNIAWRTILYVNLKKLTMKLFIEAVCKSC